MNELDGFATTTFRSHFFSLSYEFTSIIYNNPYRAAALVLLSLFLPLFVPQLSLLFWLVIIFLILFSISLMAQEDAANFIVFLFQRSINCAEKAKGKRKMEELEKARESLYWADRILYNSLILGIKDLPIIPETVYYHQLDELKENILTKVIPALEEQQKPALFLNKFARLVLSGDFKGANGFTQKLEKKDRYSVRKVTIFKNFAKTLWCRIVIFLLILAVSWITLFYFQESLGIDNNTRFLGVLAIAALAYPISGSIQKKTIEILN